MIFLRKQAVFFLVIYFPTAAMAQKYSVHRQNKAYLGVLSGINFSGTSVTDKYGVLIQTPQSNNGTEKAYEKLAKNKGSQYGLYMSYSFTKQLSIVLQPSYQRMSFNYRTSYSWTDTVNNSDYAIEMMHEQRLNNFNIPILARYDFSTLQFSPYVQGGIYMSFLNKAGKTIYYDNTIDQKVDKEKADNTGQFDYSNQFFKANFGVSAGVGITYFANYFAISLESNFRYGFRKVVNDQNRYRDDSGYGMQYLDALDQLRLFNLDIQLTLMFPIDNSISLGILKKSRY